MKLIELRQLDVFAVATLISAFPSTQAGMLVVANRDGGEQNSSLDKDMRLIGKPQLQQNHRSDY